MSDEMKAWIAIISALLTPIGVAVWRVIERKDQRTDKGSDLLSARDERNWQRIERQLDGCYRRIRELEAEIRVLETDRDDGWDLAREWHRRAADTHWTAVTICRATKGGDGRPVLEMPPLPAFREALRKPEPPKD